MSKVEVFEKEGAFGLRSNTAISKGEEILHLVGETSEYPTKYTVQIATNSHIGSYFSQNCEGDESNFWRFLNHSCNPNAGFQFPEKKLLALREIGNGEEITFNYLTTEYKMHSPLECTCGSQECHQQISGYVFLDEERRNSIDELVAPYLKGME